MKIWKISFSRNSELKDTEENLQYCLSHGYVAVLKHKGEVKKWNEQFGEFREYSSELYAIFDQIEENDLVWTRDHLGVYFLGRILHYSTLKKKGNKSPPRLKAECRWFRIGTVDSISQEIIDAFEPYRKFRLIGNSEANLYSRLVYNELVDSYQYAIPEIARGDLFSLFSALDCLDIVALYLQQFHGYRVIPSTFIQETGIFDFTVSIGNNGRSGVVKVSVDGKLIDPDNYTSFHGPIYIFAPYTIIEGLIPPNMHVISMKELQEFMFKNISSLPLRIGNRVRHYLQTVGFGDLQ